MKIPKRINCKCDGNVINVNRLEVENRDDTRCGSLITISIPLRVSDEGNEERSVRYSLSI